MTLEPYFAELRFKAVPIQEVTVRFLCGKCGALVKSKDKVETICGKCGTRNYIE